MQPEARIVKRIRQLAEGRGARVVKIWGDEESFQERGVSDLLICYRGRFVAMEVKTPHGRVARVQERFLQSVRDAGGVGVVVMSADEAETVFDGLDLVR